MSTENETNHAEAEMEEELQFRGEMVYHVLIVGTQDHVRDFYTYLQRHEISPTRTIFGGRISPEQSLFEGLFHRSDKPLVELFPVVLLTEGAEREWLITNHRAELARKAGNSLAPEDP